MSIASPARIPAATLLLGALASPAALATNGYYAAGYGTKSEGVAGAGIAFPQDTLTIATNPAGLTGIADGFDLGVDFFQPKREATLVQGGNAQSFTGDGTSTFYVPALGIAHHLGPRTAVGVALFGNGGLQTDYASNPFARFGATGNAGVDLQQAFLSPAIAHEIAPGHSLGLALNLGYQKFHATGISLFSGFSSAPGQVSDRGYDHATGIGARIGWLSHVNSVLAIGATWESKTSFGKFRKYAGLFADQGGFDAPSTYGVGVAVTPDSRWTIALDWQRIEYSKINSVGDSVASLFAGVPLGASHGPGFGWRDVSAYKLGVSYRPAADWVLRAGASTNRQPIPAGETFFNILAPGVVENHYTVGLTWSATRQDDINLSVLRAPKKTVYGSGSIPVAFGGGEANISLEETSIGIGWSHRL